MAYIREEYCKECESITLHIDRKCRNCSERLERDKITVWNALTIEEKLKDLRKRIEKLEHGELRY